MKKSFRTTVLLLLFTVTALSQSHKFQFGVDGGPSVSSLRGFEQLVELKPIVAFSAGLSAQYNFSNKLSVVTGIGFERKGTETKDNLLLTDKKGNVIDKYPLQTRYDYLNVPLMLRFTIGENKFKLFVNAGGYVGFLIQADFVILGFDNPDVGDDDFTEDVKGSDFGVSGGIGVSYQIKERLCITFEVRDNLGLYNVSELEILNDGTNKLNSTNFLLGVNFGFGGK